MINVILANAFSIQMLDMTVEQNICVSPLSEDGVKAILAEGFTSAIGHQNTADVLADLLGTDVPCDRANIALDATTTLVVAQLTGGRLPEAATTLPEGFAFKFVSVALA